MNRVIVIGCPGSGKSTFSRTLHDITGIPLYHLDMMYWNEDRTKVSKELFMEKLNRTMNGVQWIIDGNYGSTMEKRMQACDTIFFLDYPVQVCINGILERRGKKRTDMPWIESADKVDEEFLGVVKNYNVESRPMVMELLNKYQDKEVIVFKGREDAKKYLLNIKNDK